MDELSLEERKAIARSYEELLVPAIFEVGARRLLEVARPEPGDDVLDVACGTGVLARAAAEHTGSEGEVVGLDMNPGMLAVAEDLAPDLEWREGRAEELPFEDRSFDVVACQLSLMFFDDQKAAIREMLRVLKPDGRLVVTVFDSVDEIPGYARLIDIYDRVCDGEVRQFLKAPFSLSDTNQIRALFAESGLPSPRVSTEELAVSFPNVMELVLADVEGWFPLAGIELDEGQTEDVIRSARSALDEYIQDDGSVAFGMPSHFITNSGGLK